MDSNRIRFRYIINYILPALVTIALFVVLLLVFILPYFEKQLIQRKRELLRELTYQATSIFGELKTQADSGIISNDEAKRIAITAIGQIRYGADKKGYFWINDMEPVMIYHPYRKDLVGKKLDSFKDPDGKAIFLDFIDIARTKGEGFTQYLWEELEDTSRIIPKLAFVKYFEPWNWIIGTGIHFEDIQKEIYHIKVRIGVISGAIFLVISMLLISIIRQSLKSERTRALAEEELQKAKEKYEALVETSPDGTAMFIEGKFVYANLIFMAMTGYTQKEISQLNFNDLFVKKSDPDFSMDKLEKTLDESGKTTNFESEVISKDGKKRDVIVMASAIKYLEKEGIIFITRDMSRKEQLGMEKEVLSDELQSSLLLMNLPVTSIMKEPIRCHMNQTIFEAALLMSRNDHDAILIIQDDRKNIGIVTDTDLRNRVVAGEYPFNKPVFEIMSSPVVTIPDQALLFEAVLLVKEKGISHLAVADRKGEVVGIFSNKDLIDVQRNSISYLINEIKSAKTILTLKDIHNKVPGLVKTLLDSGARIQNITHLISTMTDATTERVVEFAIEEMGKPPVNFAFLALGSEGRREQTLVTDQDNAIVYENVPYEKMADINRYFLYLGQKINLWLDRIGYNYCQGEIMAGNPQWCQPVSRWKDYFTNWITNESINGSLGISIFFDFRTVYGDPQYASQLRSHIDKTTYDRTDFYKRLAEDTLKYKMPVNIFKSATSDSPSAKTEVMDLKTGIMPITDFARVYSLYHRVSESNTLLRLEKIFQRGELEKTEYEELFHAYDFLMSVRFKRQISALLENEIPKNIISAQDLTEIERSTIRSIFSRVTSYQSRLVNDVKWS
jgi:PAS domain S-box-containing protein